MLNLINKFENKQIKNLSINLNIGDLVDVSVFVIDGEKKRLQIFDGIIIAIRNRGLRSSFTVRKISNNEGIERVFQMYSPNINSILIKRRSKVNKAKLYYLRKRIGKNARIKEYIK